MPLPKTMCSKCGKRKLNGLFAPSMFRPGRNPVCILCGKTSHIHRGNAVPGYSWREQSKLDNAKRDAGVKDLHVWGK